LNALQITSRFAAKRMKRQPAPRQGSTSSFAMLAKTKLRVKHEGKH
jgi:hypothetical protein